MPPPVARSTAEIRGLSPRNSAVTLGVFDGVHLGHRRIIERLIERRDHGNADACYLITFDPHPLTVTHSKVTPPILTTVDERVRLVSDFDLDGIVVLPFDAEMAALDYRSFIDRYLHDALDMTELVLGYDCHFGRNREGSPDKVAEEGKRRGFGVGIVEEQSAGGEVVSSTRIRNALSEGDLERANRLLGHPYLISGTVVHGHGRGRELGFPTANLAIADAYKLWPPRGVYAVEVEIDGHREAGMMNVGSAPTLKDKDPQSHEIEIHVLDYEGDLYGKPLWVFCHSYMREEKRFPSPDALVEQLQKDRDLARLCLRDAAGL